MNIPLPTTLCSVLTEKCKILGNCYGLNCVPHTQQELYVDALTLSVMAFGNGDLGDSPGFRLGHEHEAFMMGLVPL